VVFSAGNTSEDVPPPNSVAPANYPESFAVGSVGTDSSDIEISFFSAGGPSACDDSIYPELVAPGFAIKTSDLTEEGALNSYVTVTGTSFSAPHVSGAMALLLGAFPETSVTALETALKQSATDLGPAGRDNVYGYGLVDVLAAYSVLREAVNTPPVAPQPVLPADGATVGTSVTFSWQPASDADGDAVSQFLVYSSHEDFSAATTLPVDSVTQAMLGGSLLLGIQLFGLIRRRRKLCLALVLSGLLLAMVACGGGGGGGGNDSEPQPETQSITVNNFVAGTYYWKMVARDSRGAETESGVRSFVVQ
jgi:bacillopeptidase F